MNFVKYISFLCAFHLNHNMKVDYKVKQCVKATEQCFYQKFTPHRVDISLVHFCVNKSLEQMK